MNERFDDWSNSAVGFGTAGDKHTATTFTRRARAPRGMLTAMYEQNPIVARVVDKAADDAFRPGPGGARPWTLGGLPSGVNQDGLMKAIDLLAIDTNVIQILKWGNLYGGALGMLPVFDGLTPDQPLDLSAVRAFFPVQVITAHDAIPYEIDMNLGSPTWHQVLSYDIVGVHTRSVRVHHSRVIKYEPIPLPYEALIMSVTRWGPSLIERLLDDLAKDGASASHALSMMYVASVLYAKLEGYRARATGKDGKAKVREILSDMRRQLDALGILGLDKADEIGNLQLSVAGAHELIDRMRNRLAAASPMPREILFNESPTGLRGGELSGAQDLWYGTVGTLRRQVITPMIKRILQIAFIAWGLPSDLSWDVEWSPLWVPRPEDQATVYKTTAEGDAIYLDRGVYQDDEVRRHRSRGLDGPIDIGDEDEVPPLDITPEDVAAAEAAAAAPVPGVPAETTPADTAMSGVQVTALLQIMKDVNAGPAGGGISYEQGLGALRLAFPSARGREAETLGPPPPPAPVGAPSVAPAAPGVVPGVPTPETDAAKPETGPAPGDAVSPAKAAEIWGVPTRTISDAVRRGPDSVDPKTGRPNGLHHWGLGSRVLVSLAEVQRLATAHERPQDAPEGEGGSDAGGA